MSKPLTSISATTKSHKCLIPSTKKAKTQIIAELLITNPILLDKWSQFSDELKCSAQEKKVWEREIKNGTGDFYDIFTKILNSWTLKNPNTTVKDLVEILKKLNCFAVVDKLKENLGLDHNSVLQSEQLPIQTQKTNWRRASVPADFLRYGEEITWPFSHGILNTASNFSGRDQELEKLNFYFNTNANLILVCGFGGIGKTELCRKFVNAIPIISDKSISRIWLNGETDETLRDSVLQIVSELGIKKKAHLRPSMHFQHLAPIILENCNKLLVVIDNLDVAYPEVKKVIKAIQNTNDGSSTFIMVTSRNSLVLDNAGFTIELEVLAQQQARTLLQKSITELTDSDADDLAVKVQYFPLALQQAVAYIKQQRNNFRTKGYTVSHYVQDFEAKKSDMLGQCLNEFEHEYSMTTLVTWDLTIGKLSETAVAILKILANLEPDKIYLEYLERILKRMHLNDFDGGLNMLLHYSLIKLESDKVVSIHRLVQEVMRRKLQNFDAKALFESALLACKKFYQFEHKGPTELELGHLKNVYRFAWKCELGYIRNFSEGLLLLLEHDRLDGAIEYCKLHLPHIQFSSKQNEGKKKREFSEKIFLWSFVNNDAFLKPANILLGCYNVTRFLGFFKFDCRKLLTAGLKVCVKYFSEKAPEFKLKLAKSWCDVRNVDEAIALCEELISLTFHDEKLKESYIETMNGIFLVLKNVDQTSGGVHILRIQRVIKIVAHLRKLLQFNQTVIEINANTLNLIGCYESSIRLFTQLIHHFEKVENKKEVDRCTNIVDGIKLQLIDRGTATKEAIENEFSKVNYDRLTLQALEKILGNYESILGNEHPLTTRVRKAMTWQY